MYVFNAAWLALAVVLTGVGVAATALLFRRRGTRGLVLGAAWTLVPMALYLTGTLRVLGVVLDVVAGYVVGFAFSPAVWIGVALAGLSALLFGVARSMRPAPRRGVDRAAPQVERSTTRPTSPVDDDLDDIEALLRKRGIS